MWEFDEAVEVRSDVVDGVETPDQFLWRGRLWRVCSVQAHWTETAAWWERGIIGAGLGPSYDARTRPAEEAGAATHTNGAVGVLDADWGPRRSVYRVEAGCGRQGRRELFDLAHDPDSGRWQLERVTDR
ncbi:DUF6504 family protein [Kribbella sp. CA-247076]|uniref:DUF6504 family protein n=1 Tax=Kribbella sp. CA-247076 TaxID=3239941 RepID=UPI003D94C10B